MPRGLIDPRHGPAWDLAGGELRRALVVASTPRTASTLLCRLLWATGLAGAPREYVNPVGLRDWAWRRSGPVARVALERVPVDAVPGWAAVAQRSGAFRRAHLGAVVDARTDRHGIWSTKLHAHHARVWWSELRPLDPVVVRLSREDRVGQAISWARARRTGRWSSEQRGRGWADRPDPAAVDRALARIDADERWWQAQLSGRPVLHLSTEALVADPTAAVRQVLEALGVPGAQEVVVPAPWTPPQRDGRTALWRDAWRRSRGEGSDLHRRLG